MLLAALPLLWTPDVIVRRHVPGAYRAAIPGMKLFLADGWIGAGYHFVWQIALFLSLGESFVAYGGALALPHWLAPSRALCWAGISMPDMGRAQCPMQSACSS